MRTVQEILQEVKEKDLIKMYFCEHPIEFTRIKNKHLTLLEIRKIHEKNLLVYIRKLKKLKVIKKIEKEQMIFYGAQLSMWSEKDIYACLVKKTALIS